MNIHTLFSVCTYTLDYSFSHTRKDNKMPGANKNKQHAYARLAASFKDGSFREAGRMGPKYRLRLRLWHWFHFRLSIKPNGQEHLTQSGSKDARQALFAFPFLLLLFTFILITFWPPAKFCPFTLHLMKPRRLQELRINTRVHRKLFRPTFWTNHRLICPAHTETKWKKFFLWPANKISRPINRCSP